MRTTSGNGLASNRASLHCEELESRENPSNVFAGLNSSNNLVIGGDNLGNIFTLYENTVGDYFMIAGTGTLINGQGAINLGAIHPFNIIVRDGSGNNNMAIFGVHPTNGLSIITGNGNDFVNLSGVVTNYIATNEGNGNNTLTTSASRAQIGASLVVGTGDSTWNNNGLTAGQFIKPIGWSKING